MSTLGVLAMLFAMATPSPAIERTAQQRSAAFPLPAAAEVSQRDSYVSERYKSFWSRVTLFDMMPYLSDTFAGFIGNAGRPKIENNNG
jgi:hypothetical protein